MWEPRRLATLWAFTAYYRDSFTLTFTNVYDSHITWTDLSLNNTIKLHRPAVMLIFKRFKRTSLWAARLSVIMHLLFVFVSWSIKLTSLNKLRQISSHPTHEMSPVLVVIERIWPQDAFRIISMPVCPFYNDSMGWNDSLDSPDNPTKNISFVLNQRTSR
jgi:hypothetical protein